MKSYRTYKGAQRAANGKPIIRLLDDPQDIFIVVNSLRTDVMVYTTDGPTSRRYQFAGKTSAFDIAT